MTQLKRFTQITPLVLALVFTNTALATDSITNENSNSQPDNAIRDNDSPGLIVGGATFSLERNEYTSPCYQPRQWQKAQPDDYKHFLEIRKQQTYLLNSTSANNNQPADIKVSYKTTIQIMEERREATEERRKTMQLEMYHTNITPADADKT
jgi:hypothetical protein